jgi:hypothetical protein
MVMVTVMVMVMVRKGQKERDKRGARGERRRLEAEVRGGG